MLLYVSEGLGIERIYKAKENWRVIEKVMQPIADMFYLSKKKLY
jgi:hypothetical protein